MGPATSGGPHPPHVNQDSFEDNGQQHGSVLHTGNHIPERRIRSELAIEYKQTKKSMVQDWVASAPSITGVPGPSDWQVQEGERRHVSSNDTSQTFDKTYGVRENDRVEFFQEGRVFQTLWIAPHTHSDADTFISVVKFGMSVKTKIRRFIVVREGEGNCICFPVTTYDGLGYKRLGINLSEHGFIFNRQEPEPIAGLGKAALKLDLSKGVIKLAEPSLVNYGRVYTVETNVEVKDVGKLDTESRRILRRYYKEVTMGPDGDLEFSLDRNGPKTQAAVLVGMSGGTNASTPIEMKLLEVTQPRSYPAPVAGLTAGCGHQVTSNSNHSVKETVQPPQEAPNGGKNTLVSTENPITEEYQPRYSPESASFLIAEDEIYLPTFEQVMGSRSEISKNKTNKKRYSSEGKLPATARSPVALNGAQTQIRRRLENTTHENHHGFINVSSEVALKPVDMRQSHPYLSRTSSLESIESLRSTGSSQSSLTSLAIHLETDGGDRLLELLTKDVELSSLYNEALHKVSPAKLGNNLRRCLVQFSKHLHAEGAESPKIVATARLVRRHARNAAQQIQNILESQKVKERMAQVDATHPYGEHDSGSSDGEDLEFFKAGLSEENNILDDLEAIIQSSRAFSMLRENFRLFVQPDPVKKALFKVWPFTQSRETTLEIMYDVQWDVNNFLKDHFIEGQQLRNVMTLTGDAVDAQAMSCYDYILMVWPKTGPVLWDALENLHPRIPTVDAKHPSIKIRLKEKAMTEGDEKPRMCLAVETSHSNHVELVSAISWLISAVRYSSNSEVCYSSLVVEGVTEQGSCPIITLNLNELEVLQPSRACWHALYPHAVIARGFPAQSRKEGRGLEISFFDMTLMSRGLNLIPYDGGLIIEGLTSLLIPMAILSEDDAVQWHFEEKRDRISQKTLSVSRTFKMRGILNWHKTTQPCDLLERRCFLGWVLEANVVMGTSTYSPDIKTSSAPRCPARRHVSSYNLTAQVSLLGFATIGAERAREPVSNPCNLTLPIDKDIHDTLADAANEHVFMYDYNMKTCWSLPQASLVLFLAHMIINRREYHIYNGSERVSLGFAQPGSDGAARALDVLKGSLALKVQKCVSPPVLEDFSNVIRQIWQALNTIRTSLESAQIEYERNGGAAPKFLHGVEFSDLVNLHGSAAIKQAEVKQPWVHLTTEQSVVLFCNELGQPIVPCESAIICEKWRMVPADRNLLVTMAPAVANILDDGMVTGKGYRLNERIEWIVKQSILQVHGGVKIDAVLHTQSLRSAKAATFRKGILESVIAHPAACYLFSDENFSWYCNLPPRSIISTAQFYKEVMVDLPDEASATSDEMEGSFDKSSFSTSSSLSQQANEPAPPTSRMSKGHRFAQSCGRRLGKAW